MILPSPTHFLPEKFIPLHTTEEANRDNAIAHPSISKKILHGLAGVGIFSAAGYRAYEFAKVAKHLGDYVGLGVSTTTVIYFGCHMISLGFNDQTHAPNPVAEELLTEQ